MPKLHQITEDSPLLHDVNCVYCHVDLVLNDQVVVCDLCNSPHHQECWQTNNEHCATFGCTGSGIARVAPMDDPAQESSGTHQGGSQSSRPTPRFDRPSKFLEISTLFALVKALSLRFVLVFVTISVCILMILLLLFRTDISDRIVMILLFTIFIPSVIWLKWIEIKNMM